MQARRHSIQVQRKKRRLVSGLSMLPQRISQRNDTANSRHQWTCCMPQVTKSMHSFEVMPGTYIRPVHFTTAPSSGTSTTRPKYRSYIQQKAFSDTRIMLWHLPVKPCREQCYWKCDELKGGGQRVVQPLWSTERWKDPKRAPLKTNLIVLRNASRFLREPPFPESQN